MRTITHYREIKIKGVRRWTDENGKRRKQQKTFYQTVSPFNCHKDGTVKTPLEIRNDLLEEVRKWEQS